MHGGDKMPAAVYSAHPVAAPWGRPGPAGHAGGWLQAPGQGACQMPAKSTTAPLGVPLAWPS